MADQPVPTREGFIDADGHRHSLGVLRRRAAARRCACSTASPCQTKAWYGFLPLLQPTSSTSCSTTTSARASRPQPDEPYSITRIAAVPDDDHGRARDRARSTRWGSRTAGSSPSSTPASSHRPPAHADAVRDHPLARGAVRAVRGDLAALLPRGPGALRPLHRLPVREDLRRAVRAQGRRATALEPMRQRFDDRYKNEHPLPDPAHRGAGGVLRRARQPDAGVPRRDHADADHARRAGPGHPAVGAEEDARRLPQLALAD